MRHQVHLARGVKECLVDTAANLRQDKRVVQGISTRSLVQAIPALQTLATFRGRDYVSTEDIEYLLPYLFTHRMELMPGADHPEAIIQAAAQRPLETLSRSTIRSA
jgi:MoxR-like ATPase